MLHTDYCTQELAALLTTNPAAIQIAFMQTAAACYHSTKQDSIASNTSSSCCSSQDGSSSPQMRQQLPPQQQQRYSLVPIAALPQLLGAALPGWGGADISYAALQIRCHMNIVANFTLDTPTSTSTSTGSSSGNNSNAEDCCSSQPVDLMYAELAATIISAASTEAATASRQLPATVQQLVVDLTDEVMSNAETRGRLATAWCAAAASAASNAATSHPTGSAEAAGAVTPVLPVVAAVRLLCKQFIASVGLRDIRLLGWLTCLVRQQHLAVQLEGLCDGSIGSSSNGTQPGDAHACRPVQEQQQQQHGPVSAGAAVHVGVLTAQIGLDELCEVLLQIVQGLLPDEDAALVEEFKQQQQQPQHAGDDWEAGGAPKATGTEAGAGSSSPPRRHRVVFNGASPTASEGSASWFSGAGGHGRLDDFLDSGFFQPSHVQEFGSMAENFPSSPNPRDCAVAGTEFADAFVTVLPAQYSAGWASLDSNCTGGCGSMGGASAGGGAPLIPASLQQERQQLMRLRAAQQQAWQLEMLLQYQPWEGAYSPVAAAAAAAERGCFAPSMLHSVNILRLSSGGYRSSSASECC